jgi:hypothetical protein
LSASNAVAIGDVVCIFVVRGSAAQRYHFSSDSGSVGLQADQLLYNRWYPIGVAAAPTKVHPQVAAIGPTQVHKCHPLKPLCGAAYRGQGRMGTGCIWPGGQPPATFFAPR